MKEELVALIEELTREILDAEGRSYDALTADTRLFGKQGLLDSMGIVSLVIAVEQAIEDRHGATVALADEKALSQNAGPYRSIGTLAEYASTLLESTR